MNKAVWKILVYICMYLGLAMFAFAIWLDYDVQLQAKFSEWISIDVLFWLGGVMGFGGLIVARRLENVYIDRR